MANLIVSVFKFLLFSLKTGCLFLVFSFVQACGGQKAIDAHLCQHADPKIFMSCSSILLLNKGGYDEPIDQEDLFARLLNHARFQITAYPGGECKLTNGKPTEDGYEPAVKCNVGGHCIDFSSGLLVVDGYITRQYISNEEILPILYSISYMDRDYLAFCTQNIQSAAYFDVELRNYLYEVNSHKVAVNTTIGTGGYLVYGDVDLNGDIDVLDFRYNDMINSPDTMSIVAMDAFETRQVLYKGEPLCASVLLNDESGMLRILDLFWPEFEWEKSE